MSKPHLNQDNIKIIHLRATTKQKQQQSDVEIINDNDKSLSDITKGKWCSCLCIWLTPNDKCRYYFLGKLFIQTEWVLSKLTRIHIPFTTPLHLQEQSDLGPHGLPRLVCPKTLEHYGKFLKQFYHICLQKLLSQHIMIPIPIPTPPPLCKLRHLDTWQYIETSNSRTCHSRH